MEDNNNEAVAAAISCGLTTLSDPDLRVPASNIEALANFKGLLRGLLQGTLVLATPDKLLPEVVEVPKENE